jgi:hypothetical protein
VERESLVLALLAIVGGYRDGLIGLDDSTHVEKWLNQFDVSESEKNIILLETINMLKKHYISKEKAVSCLRRFYKKISEQLTGKTLKDVNFLRTQPAGKSQHDLLILSDLILQEDFGFSLNECGGSDVFIYIDDCIYSGNKFRYDIHNWLQDVPSKIELISYHLLWHTCGYDYASRCVNDNISSKKGSFQGWRSYDINNSRISQDPLQIFWPRYVKGNVKVDAFAQIIMEQRRSYGITGGDIFRPANNLKHEFFSSSMSQNVIEQAFLNCGVNRYYAAQNPAASVRPMGFEKLSTIGFGSPVVTYRNIANNAPLALWYGDQSYGPSHPLGQWYPLFSRKN